MNAALSAAAEVFFNHVGAVVVFSLVALCAGVLILLCCLGDKK